MIDNTNNTNNWLLSHCNVNYVLQNQNCNRLPVNSWIIIQKFHNMWWVFPFIRAVHLPTHCILRCVCDDHAFRRLKLMWPLINIWGKKEYWTYHENYLEFIHLNGNNEIVRHIYTTWCTQGANEKKKNTPKKEHWHTHTYKKRAIQRNSNNNNNNNNNE